MIAPSLASPSDDNAQADPSSLLIDTSRKELKRELEKRRMSLTVAEATFLDQLVIHGNEVEVTLAQRQLENNDLFFEEEDDAEDFEEKPRPKLQRQLSLGSQRRLKVLQDRKEQGKSPLWQAHESGLAVTHAGSRLSLLVRQGSLSSISTGNNAPPTDIFRRLDPKKPYKRSNSISTPPRIPAPVKFSIRRNSSSSRKSVSFHPSTPLVSPSKKKVVRPDSDTQGQEISGRPPLFQRSDSVTSIPSIRPAQPIRSDSLTSIPSIPNIQMAQPVRSESASSISSLHLANAIPNTDSIFLSRQTSTASVPSLHQANSVHSSAISRKTSVSSIPSLHEANSVHSEAKNSLLQESLETARNSLMADVPKEQQLIAPLSATPDIAAAWLQQQQGKFQSKSLLDDNSTVGSFPPAIAIPSTVTEGSSEKDSMEQAVLMRRASKNLYEGEGIELVPNKPRDIQPSALHRFESVDISAFSCNSMDESSHYGINNADDIFRSNDLRRSLSEEDAGSANMRDLFVGANPAMLFRDISNITKIYANEDDDEESSWDLNSTSGAAHRYDSWNIVKDEYINGYGGGGALDFSILGTCADDKTASPHVLSPPLMESLSAFLPYSKSGENFFLRYSLVRDGASMHTFLKRARGVDYSILALETVDGEVFGSFNPTPWRKNWNYFGSSESFLWKMRRSRLIKTTGILEQAQLESEIDVYPYTGDNDYIQLCTQDRLAVGGGSPESGEKKDENDPAMHDFGFGLAIQGDLLEGSSSPCVTFGSPSLSALHPDGSLFEIINLELWTLTPCGTEDEAEKLELGKLFLQQNFN